jgi:hypothetical protein
LKRRRQTAFDRCLRGSTQRFNQSHDR